jgi:adhesin transport system outer membrane protein
MNWLYNYRALMTGVIRVAAALPLATMASLTQAASPPPADGLRLALTAAVSRNPAVRNKLADLRALGFKVQEAQAARYPSLTVQAQSMSEQTSHGVARVQQPLYAFGRIDGAIELAGMQTVLGQMSVLEVRRKLLEDTAASYVGLLGARAKLILAERNVDEHQRLFQMIQRRHEGGIASEADARLASSRLIQAKTLLEQLRGQVDKGENELFALTRLTLPGRESVEPTLTELPNLSALLSLADTSVSLVRQRQAELDLARVQATQRRAELMPTLYARWEHDIAPAAGSLNTNRVGVVLEASIDGFGLVVKPRLAAEAERIAAAQENLEAARNETTRRLTGLLSDRQTQQLLVTANESAVQAVEETLASFLRQYDAGRKSWVDVLNTQREMSDARQQLQAVRTAWQENSLRIAALLGLLDVVAEMAP